MELFLTGLNNSHASAQRLERLSGRFEGIFLALTEVVKTSRRNDLPVEAVLVSTCNRVELIGWGDEAFRRKLHGILRRFSVKANQRTDLKGQAVADHLFRVVCGLESLQIGESMVASQVKDAYRRALTAGLSGQVTHRLFQRGFQVAHRVREAAGNPVSAMERIEHGLRMAERWSPLAGTDYGLLGTGSMLIKFDRLLPMRGARRIVHGIRDYRGDDPTLCPLETARALLRDCNLIIIDSASVRADLRLVDLEIIRRSGREVVILDYSHSRGVDPACRNLEGIVHYGREELEPLASPAIQPQSIGPDERIAAEVKSFQDWLDRLAWNQILGWLANGIHETFDQTMSPVTLTARQRQRFREAASRTLRQRLKKIIPENDPRLGELIREIQCAVIPDESDDTPLFEE